MIYTFTKKQKQILPKLMVFAYQSEDVTGLIYVDAYGAFDTEDSIDGNCEVGFQQPHDTYNDEQRQALNEIRRLYIRNKC